MRRGRFLFAWLACVSLWVMLWCVNLFFGCWVFVNFCCHKLCYSAMFLSATRGLFGRGFGGESTGKGA